jgi:hypothetical protein
MEHFNDTRDNVQFGWWHVEPLIEGFNHLGADFFARVLTEVVEGLEEDVLA